MTEKNTKQQGKENTQLAKKLADKAKILRISTNKLYKTQEKSQFEVFSSVVEYSHTIGFFWQDIT